MTADLDLRDRARRGLNLDPSLTCRILEAFIRDEIEKVWHPACRRGVVGRNRLGRQLRPGRACLRT